MERFTRLVVGYHGCTADFADELLLGHKSIDEWNVSTNDWDWLGNGIYFWEHSPERAGRWAREKYSPRGQSPAVLGAILQLGLCFDLLTERFTSLLANDYLRLEETYREQSKAMPINGGIEGKRRSRDCLVINDCLTRLRPQRSFDTVRGAFWEGDPVYPTAGFRRETHIQIAVRNSACILGVFRPNLTI